MYTSWKILIITSNEDISKAILNFRAGLWGEVKRLRSDGYYDVIKYGRIVTNKWDELAGEPMSSIQC